MYSVNQKLEFNFKNLIFLKTIVQAAGCAQADILDYESLYYNRNNRNLTIIKLMGRFIERRTSIARQNLLLGVLIFLLTNNATRADIFTAIAEMEELLNTESVLLNNLENYINSEQEKLDFLERKFKTYQKEHGQAAEDVVTYLSNPVNGFLLTKRLTVDWKEVENLMNAEIGPGSFNQNIIMLGSSQHQSSSEDEFDTDRFEKLDHDSSYCS